MPITHTHTNTGPPHGKYLSSGFKNNKRLIPDGTSAQSVKRFVEFGPQHEKTCLRWFTNNKGTDQPIHLRSLGSAYVIRISESILSKLATNKIAIF